MRPWAALAALLLLPSVAAEPAWDAPEAARAGHPVFAAVSASPGDAVDVQVRMDGFLLWEATFSPDGGFQPLVVTAPAGGTLLLVARVGDDEAVHAVAVADAPRHETHPGVADYPGLQMHWDLDGFGAEADVPLAALGTLTDAQDRLLLSSWDLDASGTVSRHAAVPPVPPHAVVVPHPDDGRDRGATLVAATTQAPATRVLPTTGAATLPACGDEVVFDPAPGVAWQSGTTVHVAHRDGGPVRYMLQRAGIDLLGTEPALLFDTTADDPHGALAFTPQAGPMVLFVEREGERCAVEFLALPGAGEATLHVSVQPTPSQGVRVDLEAVQDGVAVPDVAVDVRVLRLPYEDTGRLVWAGSVQTPDGSARFHTHFLEPGTYRVMAYASPRGVTGPSFPGQGPTEFTIDALPDARQQVEAGLMPHWVQSPAPAEEEAPGERSPLPVALVASALLVALLRRR